MTYEPPQSGGTTYVDDLLNAAKRGRVRYERIWYQNLRFFENLHFTRYDRISGTFSALRAPTAADWRYVPIASRQIRAIANILSMADEKFVVYPKEGEEPDEEQVRRVGDFLDEVFQQNVMTIKKMEAIQNALIMPVSYFQIGGTENGIPFIDVYDAFDIYHMPGITELEQSPWIIKTVRKPLEEVKRNPLYKNTENLAPDNKFAEATYKDIREREKYTGFIGDMPSEAQTIILKEAWIREDDGKIKVVTSAGNQILREQKTELIHFPFVEYRPFVGPLYQPAWIEYIMPLNKSIDTITYRIEQFINIMVRGAYLVQRGTKVKRLTNENGEIIEYTGTPPTALPIPQFPQFVFLHLNNLISWIQEQGVSPVTMGKLPKGVRAYRTAELLRQQDVASMGNAQKNLAVAMQKVAERVLEIADLSIKEPLTIARTTKLGKPETFKVIGERNRVVDTEAFPISSKHKVKVEIEDALSHSEEGKRSTIMELYQMGAVDLETLLESLRFSNVGDIIERVKQRKAQEVADQMLTKGAVLPQAGTPSGSSPEPPTPPDRLSMESVSGLPNVGVL